jgi:hypothetical protein
VTAAARQRLHAARRRDGLAVLPVIVIELDVVAMLQARDWLADLQPPGLLRDRASGEHGLTARYR